MFFFKIISKSIWNELKEDLCVVSVSPAVENTLSHGTEVADIPQINIDRVERSGYLRLLACHHNNGFNSRGAGFSLL